MLLDASGWSENPACAHGKLLSGIEQVRGGNFDVEGVLVDSAHEHAWQDALRQLMDTDWRGICDWTTYSPERFTPKVYQSMSSRLSGVCRTTSFTRE